MAAGKTHDWVTYVLILPTMWVGYGLLGLSMYIMILVGLGVWIGGIYLSPDLDTRSRPFYRWGPLRFIWWPYQWVAKHRSSLSHGIVWAPIFRCVYLTAILILLYLVMTNAINTLLYGHKPDFLGNRPEILYFFGNHAKDLLYLGVGVWLGSLYHVGLDMLASAGSVGRR